MHVPSHHEILFCLHLHKSPVGRSIQKQIDRTMHCGRPIRRQRVVRPQDDFAVFADGICKGSIPLRFGGMPVGEQHVENHGPRMLRRETLEQLGKQRAVPGSIVGLIEFTM